MQTNMVPAQEIACGEIGKKTENSNKYGVMIQISHISRRIK